MDVGLSVVVHGSQIVITANIMWLGVGFVLVILWRAIHGRLHFPHHGGGGGGGRG